MRSVCHFATLLLAAVALGCGSKPTLVIDRSDLDSGVSSRDSGSGFLGLGDSGLGVTGCAKRTCAEAGMNCGPISDGCGGLVDCGTCPSGQACGAISPSVCGAGSCTTRSTCADLGATCGQQGDGCGDVIECGTCTLPETCGGAGVSNTCGTPSGTTGEGGVCTPKSCLSMGYNCGPVADGCGGLVDCGTCATGSCGASGKPNVCGGTTAATCVKKTCADYGANCGPVSDG